MATLCEPHLNWHDLERHETRMRRQAARYGLRLRRTHSSQPEAGSYSLTHEHVVVDKVSLKDIEHFLQSLNGMSRPPVR